jgi:hypothetical protein
LIGHDAIQDSARAYPLESGRKTGRIQVSHDQGKGVEVREQLYTEEQAVSSKAWLYAFFRNLF